MHHTRKKPYMPYPYPQGSNGTICYSNSRALQVSGNYAD
jgi:hypothetical protein